MDKGEAKSIFTVVVEGELPEDTVAKLNDALQRAALSEIASIDLRGNELTFRPIMAGMVASEGGRGGGGFRIVLRPVELE